MNKTIDNLKIDQVDYVDSNVVNVFCSFDTGKGYYEGGICSDVVVRAEDDFVLVDAVKLTLSKVKTETKLSLLAMQRS